MTRIYLRIKPLDTLFFRTGTPFGGGEVTWTESTLLPNPSVIWGAVYSMMMAHKVVADDSEENQVKLAIRRVFVEKKRKGHDPEIYVPTPLDLYQYKEENGIDLLQLDKMENKLLSNYRGANDYEDKSGYLLKPQKNEVIERLEQEFIEFSSICSIDYTYQNENFGPGLVSTSNLFSKSYKVGIERNNVTKNAEEGKLYRINATRFKKGVSLLIEIDLDSELVDKLPDLGIIKLGGEARGASFEKLEHHESISNLTERIEKEFDEYRSEYINQQLLFRVYLHSSVLVDLKERLSNELNREVSKRLIKENSFKIIAACLGKPESIGGFSVKSNKPKAMKKATPKGSVYFMVAEQNQSYKDIKEAIIKLLQPIEKEQSKKSKITDEIKGYRQIEIFPSYIK